MPEVAPDPRVVTVIVDPCRFCQLPVVVINGVIQTQGARVALWAGTDGQVRITVHKEVCSG